MVVWRYCTVGHELLKAIPIAHLNTVRHCLFNFIIFADPEDALNLICMKYEIGVNLWTLVQLVWILCKYF